jgi:hypothetical protein
LQHFPKHIVKVELDFTQIRIQTIALCSLHYRCTVKRIFRYYTKKRIFRYGQQNADVSDVE